MPDDGDAYLWTDGDRKRFADRWWALPRRIVEDGTWAQLWRPSGTSRGGGAATSVLPVLALHAWPKKRSDAWSEWASVPLRQLAALSGLHIRTARAGMLQLRTCGLLELRREAMRRGGYRMRYRLAGRLYADPDSESDPYARIPSRIVYGGIWMMIPTPAARHLYGCVAAMDPIPDERAYLNRVVEDTNFNPPWLDDLQEEDEWGEPPAQQRWLAAQRARHPMSLATLQQWTGLTRRTIQGALPLLLQPVFKKDEVAHVRKGVGHDGLGHWYAIDRTADHSYWLPDFLNDPERIDRFRARHWPQNPPPRPRARGRNG